MEGTLQFEARVSEPTLGLEETCNRQHTLSIFLRVLQCSEDLEVGSKFLLFVDDEHVICVFVNSQRKVSLVDQTGSCFVENMWHDNRFTRWAGSYEYTLFHFVRGDSESARASAQAAYEAYARVTGGAFALRRARRSGRRSAGGTGPARASTLRSAIRKVAAGVRGLLAAARRRCAVARRVVARHVAKCT
jgi:hypothetical protein